MTAALRRVVKKLLYGSTPGFAGRFPYFGCKVYFPPKSVIFQAACEQGIFEAENVAVLCALAEPCTVVFDVGANIGLMAIPILRQCQDVQVVSFEPSPSTLPYLRRTVAGSKFGTRWQVIPEGVGRVTGELEFYTARIGADAFEGLRPTGRTPTAGAIRIPITTLDTVWDALGRPKVSVLKIDIEGAEIEALEGATNLLAEARPAVLMEWNETNLHSFGLHSEAILAFALQSRYRVHAIPGFAAIDTAILLRAAMSRSETFLLSPLD